MAGYNGGRGTVNMCSMTHSEDQVINHYESCCKFYGAKEEDIEITNIMPDPYRLNNPEKYANFPKTHYSVIYYTYLGWKTYMLMTGCFASDPKHEKSETSKDDDYEPPYVDYDDYGTFQEI